jgi:hypothetical protein
MANGNTRVCAPEHPDLRRARDLILQGIADQGRILVSVTVVSRLRDEIEGAPLGSITLTAENGTRRSPIVID